MKTKATSDRANEALKDLITFCEVNRGTITEIKKEMDKATGRDWNRKSLEFWLHPDPSKRVEPLLGSGLLLIDVGKKVIARRMVDIEKLHRKIMAIKKM